MTSFNETHYDFDRFHWEHEYENKKFVRRNCCTGDQHGLCGWPLIWIQKQLKLTFSRFRFDARNSIQHFQWENKMVNEIAPTISISFTRFTSRWQFGRNELSNGSQKEKNDKCQLINSAQPTNWVRRHE